jgi:hypothetical protein
LALVAHEKFNKNNFPREQFAIVVTKKGAKRYGERNWEKGQPLSRYLDSCLRHLFQHLEGRTDEKHGVAALWNLCALIWTEDAIEKDLLPKTLDDLKRKSPSKKIREK